jgi:hypothetical protein
MLFPFLALLTACIFLAARGTVFRTAVATRARNQAFARRPQANPGQPLLREHDPLTSLVESQAVAPVPGAPVFSGTTFQAQSQAFVTAQTWDYQVVDFVGALPAFTPHGGPLDLVVKNLPGLPLPSGSVLLGMRSMDFRSGGNPAIVALSSLSKTLEVPMRLGLAVLGLLGPAYVAAGVLLGVLEVEALLNFDFAAAARFNRMINLIHLGQQAIPNLRRAADGQEGTWDADLPGRIQAATP